MACGGGNIALAHPGALQALARGHTHGLVRCGWTPGQGGLSDLPAPSTNDRKLVRIDTSLWGPAGMTRGLHHVRPGGGSSSAFGRLGITERGESGPLILASSAYCGEVLTFPGSQRSKPRTTHGGPTDPQVPLCLITLYFYLNQVRGLSRRQFLDKNLPHLGLGP